MCNRVSLSRDYFTISILCLSRLLEERGVGLTVSSDCIKIGDKVARNLETDVFISCSYESNSTETCWERRGLIQKRSENILSI